MDVQLDGEWAVAVADSQRRREFARPTFDDGDWSRLSVPGHSRDLAGFNPTNEPTLWRRTFDPLPADVSRLWLSVAGVYSLGEVWVDDRYLGDTGSEFALQRFELPKSCTEPGPHIVAIEVMCANDRNAERHRAANAAFHLPSIDDPDPSPMGIAIAPRITATGPVAIRRTRLLCTEAQPTAATVLATLTLNAAHPTSAEVRLTGGGSASTSRHALTNGDNRIEASITIDNPKLWWPMGTGEPSLTELTVEVVVDGVVSDTEVRNVGLRTVRRDAGAYVVNGRRLFLKGATQGPIDLRPGRVDDARAVAAVAHALGANLNAIRVRGHVAPTALYDEADRVGMVIIQDLPLRGPYERGTADSVRDLASDLVDAVGHHASVIGYLAHDDPSGLDAIAARSTDRASQTRAERRARLAQQLPGWNRLVLDRAAVGRLRHDDPTRPAIAHTRVDPHFPLLVPSPSKLGLIGRRSETLPARLRRLPRMAEFVAEVGLAAPGTDIDAELDATWPDPPWMALVSGDRSIKRYIDDEFRPADFATGTDFAHACRNEQARSLRQAIETLRLLRDHPAGGFFVDTLIGSTRGVNSAIIDASGELRPAYQAVSDACRPLLAVHEPLPEALSTRTALATDIHVVNDGVDNIDDLTVTLYLRWDDRVHSWRWTGAAAASSVNKVATVQWRTPERPGPFRLELDLESDGHHIMNVYDHIAVAAAP